MNYPKIQLESQLFNDKEIRLSGISLVTTEPKIWDSEKKIYLHPTVYSFRYIGTDKFVSFKFDAKGNFICKL